MRFTRYTTLAMFIGTMLLTPVPAPAAASKEMQDLQRDVADAQEQIKAVGKSVAALQTMLQQNQDTANKTSATVNNLNSNLMQALQTGLKGLSDQLNSVTGLSGKVSGIGEDVSNLQSTVKDLQVSVNRQGQTLLDILNQVKLLQAPAAPPPGADSASGPGASAPPPTAQTLFTNAVRDHDAAKFDMALTEFKQFLALYPNDPSAIRAQYNIGDSYYSMGNLDEAVTAFDLTIEQYPKNEVTTPSAYYMKGMALKKQKKNAAAIASFKAVTKDFPRSEEAPQAEQQLRSLGAPATATKKGR